MARHPKTPFLLLLCLLMLPWQVQAQQSFQKWLTYNNTTKLSPTWGLTFDINHRSKNLSFEDPFLLAGRMGITYALPKNISLTGGYSWFGHLSYTSVPLRLDENRLWQQVMVQQKYPGFLLSHRFRTEQRFIEKKPEKVQPKDYFDESARFRYALQLQGPFGADIKGLQWFTSNEIMLNARENTHGSLFNQNRTLAGIIISPDQNLDLAILYQSIYQYSPLQKGMGWTNSARITLLHRLDLSSK